MSAQAACYPRRDSSAAYPAHAVAHRSKVPSSSAASRVERAALGAMCAPAHNSARLYIDPGKMLTVMAIATAAWGIVFGAGALLLQ